MGAPARAAWRGPHAPPRPAARRDGYDYGEVLRLSFRFYDAQRSGSVGGAGAGHSVPWRGDAALGDAGPDGADLSGGFFDAGDHLKHTYSLSYTLLMLAHGALEHAAGYMDAMRRTPFEVPAARVYRIDAAAVKAAKKYDKADELEYQMLMEKPWPKAGGYHAVLIDGNHRAAAAMASPRSVSSGTGAAISRWR